jgi:hypothetical protein
MNYTILFGFQRCLLQKKEQIQSFTFKTAILFLQLVRYSKKKTENKFGLFRYLEKKLFQLKRFILGVISSFFQFFFNS